MKPEHTDTPLPHSSDDINTSSKTYSASKLEDEHRIEPSHSVQSEPTVTHPRYANATPPVTHPEAIDTTLEAAPRMNAGMIVLQWLTYAFWGWTLLATSLLTSAVVSAFLIADDGYSNTGDMIAYAMAGVIVLSIVSLVTDIIFAHKEPKEKGGVGMVIMIIHAVIFALFGIGAVVIGVFAFISQFIGDDSGSSAGVGMITAAVMAVLYGATLIRTLRPKQLFGLVPKVYWGLMLLSMILLVIGGVIGPVAQARLQKQDQLVENGLPALAETINAYTKDNNQLPTNLSDLDRFNGPEYTEDAQELVRSGEVEYSPGGPLPSKINGNNSYNDEIYMDYQDDNRVMTIYTYELCVTYKTADGGYGYDDGYSGDGQRYDTYISTYGHDKGRVCYDVQTDYGYN